MEELTRVDPNEDPYLALRTALTIAICLVLADPLGITMPMMPVVLGMTLLSNQRGALTPRTFAGPLALPVVAYVFSWLASATVNTPMLFIAINVLFATAGLALMLLKGSRGGTLLTVFPVLMSMSALYSDQALVALRDGMATGGLVVGGASLVLNLLLGPQTTRVHVEQTRPLQTDDAKRELLIRLAVFIPVMLGTFATGDMNMMIVPVMLAFVAAEPDRGGRLKQLIDRGGGTVIGALVATAAMAIYYVLPQFPVLVLLCAIITYALIDKMTTGTARPLYYQYICSVALVMIMSSTYGARDAFEVVLQRVVLTTGAMVGAIAMLSLLEAIFVPRRGDATSPALA
jgi:hypothetical protein